MIINSDPPPLPEETDPDFVSLVSQMLSKDPDIRPNIYKLLETKVINDYVKAFME